MRLSYVALIMIRSISLSLILFFLSVAQMTMAQVTIGSSNPPDPSAVLDLQSTQGGLLLPRLSTTQRNALSNPPEGLVIFNTTTKCVESWFLTGWKSIECECTTPPNQPGNIQGPAQVCPGQDSVWFSVAPVSGASSYLWTINNQDTLSSGQGSDSILVHFSAGTGSRAITVSAQNGCGVSPAANLSMNVQLLDNTFTVNPSSPNVNNAAQFSANQSGASYAWTFQSGTPASSVAQNPQVTWTQTGNYQVQLTVSDNFGCSVQGSQQVTVTNCQAQTWTFTNCAQTGRTGPSQSQCNSSYGPGVVNVSSGIQEWTVPASGTYRIQAAGAEGGRGKTNSTSSYSSSTPGRGAVIQGDFSLNAGQVIRILVGQKGQEQTINNQLGGGGGGGSYVVTNTNNILVIAGGGGGSGRYNGDNGSGGQTGPSGTNGLGANGAAGGTNGNGGSNSGCGYEGGGGAGYSGNGSNPAGTNAQSYLNGGNGATWCNCWSSGNEGGFGGGGGTGPHGGGGGGGYSGGGGGGDINCGGNGGGGGGGSLNNGTNQSNTSNTHTGHGQVTITRICP